MSPLTRDELADKLEAEAELHAWTYDEPILCDRRGQPHLFGGITPGGMVRVLALDADALAVGQRVYAGSGGTRSMEDFPALPDVLPRVVERERDEAREALRDLLAEFEVAVQDKRAPSNGPLLRAEAILKGVERTHTIVPNKSLVRAAAYAEMRSGVLQTGPAASLAMRWSEAFRAAARGERVDWPGEGV
jgi:hypothetical protein